MILVALNKKKSAWPKLLFFQDFGKSVCILLEVDYLILF
jgi:hypothetical protein